MTNNITLSKPRDYNEKSKYVCGLDLARTGKDETAIVILEQPAFQDNIFVVHMETLQNKMLTESIGRVLYLHHFFNFKKIYVDETGLGGGVVDVLREKLGGIVEGVVFTTKSKPEMFTNLKILLQRKILKLPDYNSYDLAKKLYYQMMSIQQEFGSTSEVPRIFHDDRSHDDLVCALALACIFFKVGRKQRRTYPLTGRK